MSKSSRSVHSFVSLGRLFILTVYEPDAEIWCDDLKTMRSNHEAPNWQTREYTRRGCQHYAGARPNHSDVQADAGRGVRELSDGYEKLSVLRLNYRRQKCGVNRISTVKISSRPTSMPNVHTQVWKSVSPW